MNYDDELARVDSSRSERPNVMLIMPTPEPSRLVLARVAFRRSRQILTLPVLAVILGVFWGAVDLGVDLLLRAFGAQLGFVLVIKPLAKVLFENIREQRRIRRIGRFVAKNSTSSDRYLRESLQELKMCPGSGCSTQNRQDWRDNKCQHCFQPVDVSDNHIVDHLLHRITIDFQPVECDPRLVPVLLRGLGTDQEQ